MTILWGKDSQPSGLSTDSVAQSEKGADGGSMPPSRDPERLISPKTSFRDDLDGFRGVMCGVALCGFILLAVVCGLAAKFNW